MKIARTFTIDYHLYQELRKKPNQSRIVESSIKRYLNGDEDYSISEIETIPLLSIVLERGDTPNYIKVLIREYLTSV